jgi:hypothetical protein
MIVGIANEKAIFLNTGSRDPNAGAVTYWLPVTKPDEHVPVMKS